MASYEDFILYAMRGALTEREIRDVLNERTFNEQYAGRGEEGFAEALEVVARAYGLEGYESYRQHELQFSREYKEARLKETTDPYEREAIRRERPSVMPLWKWRYTPPAQRSMLLHSKHPATLPRDKYGNIKEEALEGFYLRNPSSQRVVPAEHVYGARPYDEPEPGRFGMTWPIDKEHKRLRLGGVYDLVEFAKRKLVRGVFRAGTKSISPEWGLKANVALLIGGELGASGYGLMNERTLGAPVQRYQGDVYIPEGAELAPQGALWPAGQRISVAPGTTQGRAPFWDTRLLDIKPTGEKDDRGRILHRAVFERVMPLEHASAAIKTAFGKVMLEPTRDLSRVTTTSGERLDIDFLLPIKDYGGAAWSFFQRAALQAREGGSKQFQGFMRELGIDWKPGQELPSYSKIAPQAREMFMSRIEQDYLKTIRIPRIFHKDVLGRYGLTEQDVKPLMRNGEVVPDLYRGYIEAQALVFPAFVQPMIEPHPRPGEHTISWELFQRMQRDMEGLDLPGQLWRAGRRARVAYGSILKADYATTGGGRYPKRFVRASSNRFRETLLSAYDAAYQDVVNQEGLEPGQEPDTGLVARRFFEVMSEERGLANRYILWKDPESDVGVMTPSFRRMAYFSATGEMEGEEVSSYLRRVFNMAMLASSGETGEEYRAAIERVALAQKEIAEGESTKRAAMGTRPGFDEEGREWIVGRRAMYSAALGDAEAYVPGRGGEMGYIMRYPPGVGTFSPRMRVRYLTDEEAEERGLKLGQIYVSQPIMQALAGDVDGDIVYALSTGLAQPDGQGGFVDAKGNPIDADAVRAMGEEAKRRGAADLQAELLTGRPTMSREEAVEYVRQNLGSTMYYTTDELLAQNRKSYQLYSNIGRFYQPLGRMLAAVLPEGDMAGRRAQELAHEFVYSRAQRPEKLPTQLANILNLFRVNERGGYFDLNEGKPGRLKGPKNVPGLLRTSVRNLLDVTQGFAPGELQATFTPEEYGALLGGQTPEARAIVANAVRQAAKNPERRLETVMGAVQKAAGVEGYEDINRWFAEQTNFGRAVTAPWAMKVARSAVKGFTSWAEATEDERLLISEAFKQHGELGEGRFRPLLEMGTLQEAFLAATRKGGSSEEFARATRILEQHGIGLPIAFQEAAAEGKALRPFADREQAEAEVGPGANEPLGDTLYTRADVARAASRVDWLAASRLGADPNAPGSINKVFHGYVQDVMNRLRRGGGGKGKQAAYFPASAEAKIGTDVHANIQLALGLDPENERKLPGDFKLAGIRVLGQIDVPAGTTLPGPGGGAQVYSDALFDIKPVNANKLDMSSPEAFRRSVIGQLAHHIPQVSAYVLGEEAASRGGFIPYPKGMDPEKATAQALEWLERFGPAVISDRDLWTREQLEERASTLWKQRETLAGKAVDFVSGLLSGQYKMPATGYGEQLDYAADFLGGNLGGGGGKEPPGEPPAAAAEPPGGADDILRQLLAALQGGAQPTPQARPIFSQKRVFTAGMAEDLKWRSLAEPEGRSRR